MTVVEPGFYHDPDAPYQANQYQVEFAELLHIYSLAQPQSVLEVGVCEGGTLYQWMKRATPLARFTAVDLPGARWGKGGRVKPETWQEWALDFGVTLKVIIGNSHDQGVIQQVRDFAPYDWVFIDGDHTYEGVSLDVDNFGALIVPGGYLVLHDIVPHPHDPLIGVWRLWDELKHNHEHREILSDPRQTARGIGVVHVKEYGGVQWA